MKNFIDTQEFSREELAELIGLILLLKEADRDRALPELLRRRSLGMIFEEPSTRTRVSFEVAMQKLGGHALYLKPGEIHLGERESIGDTARVLSRMCDVIEARTLKHQTVLALAANATVPVINGLTDFNHPTQAVCDVFTMSEHLPPGRGLHGSTVVFVGDRTNVCSSTMFITTQFGMNFVHAAPAAYQAPAEWLEVARANCVESGGSVAVTENVEDAVAVADYVYTDLWWWVGQEDEIPERRAAFMPRYQVNEALIERAPAHAKFMHCLPASRGVEVTDAVIDGPRSIVFDQAENRLHAEKGILTWLTYPTLKEPASEAVEADYAARVHDYLGRVGWEAGVAVGKEER
ncbi:MAG TPA: putrescine carbamoyltransferase [Solirubrobacterales bacterium]|nr:putrescine carbamoyltransferase [Solirubrobacterales bacterium]